MLHQAIYDIILGMKSYFDKENISEISKARKEGQDVRQENFSFKLDGLKEEYCEVIE